MKTWLITGGAGFIGSCLIRTILASASNPLGAVRIVNLDKLTYAGHRQNIPSPDPNRYTLRVGDIADASLVGDLLSQHQPEAVINFAAESHVDRSIDGPRTFVDTNVAGTAGLLEQTLRYFESLPPSKRARFRFMQISTDEVYGSRDTAGSFTEQSPFRPSSPYAASKASADLWVRSFHHTYGLPTVTAHCCNNYGPYQYPEKLVPLMILRAMHRQPLPIYGDGSNVRDWIHVSDHCDGIVTVLQRGRVGQSYNIGCGTGRSNLAVVEAITANVDDLLSRSGADSSGNLIEFVQDRPGHDQCYAVDVQKIASELDWRAAISFDQGIRDTVTWYLDHPEWIATVTGHRPTFSRLGLGRN